MLKKNTIFAALGAINLVCVVFHTVFQLDLLSERGIYREFLLIENMVVTFVFGCFAWVMFFGTTVQKRMMLTVNILFWVFFLLLVLVVQPTVTSLTIVEGALFMPQNYYLLFLGIVALGLSLLGYRHMRETA